MQSLQLYLNDQLADLADDSPIALTFQINNLADVKNQAGNTSDLFKLPLTQNNRRILGFPDDISVTTEVPYTQLRARLIQDGVEVIPEGLGIINSTDENNASVTILSGNVDFFDSIDNPIYEMGDSTKVAGAKQPFAPYNHIWNLANVVASRKVTNGYIYPVIDYGGLSPLKPFIVDVRKLRPGFFLKTIIDLIVSGTGYTAKGSLLSNPLYDKLIVQFANDNFEHGTDYQVQPDTIGMNATSTEDQEGAAVFVGFNTAGRRGVINFGRTDSDPQTQFTGGTTFTAEQIMTATVLVTIPKLDLRGRMGSDPCNLNINIHLHTPGGDLDYTLNYDLANYTRVPGTSGGSLQGYINYGNKTLSADIDLQVGDQITITYEFLGGAPGYFKMYSGATLYIKSKNDNMLFGQQVQCERIFPDITQKDLLKDTLQRFAIICQTDNTNREVTFASFKDIVSNIPIAKNWTNKVVNQGKTVAFQLGNYGQVNNLKYKQDDAIPEGYADDVINIADKTLQATQDLFTGQFAPSLNSPFVGGPTAQILKLDYINDPGSFEFSIGTQPRILVEEKRALYIGNSSDTVQFTDGSSTTYVNDVISTAYFYKDNGEFSLMWKDKNGQPGLRTLYYKELERILKQTKKITRYIMLNARDIQELDLLVPVYLEQDSAYFYINKIDQWIKGRPTKLELIKLGEI